jgi:hypothetical protein
MIFGRRPAPAGRLRETSVGARPGPAGAQLQAKQHSTRAMKQPASPFLMCT